MNQLEEELMYEIEWRIREISILKTIPYLYSFSKEQKKTIEKYTIPAFYSLWEGYVVSAFGIYVRKLNCLKLDYNNICSSILTHAIDVEFNLKNGRTDFLKKQELVEDLLKYILAEVNITSRFPTNSNVSFKVINDLLNRFNLDILPEKPYKKQLDKLLLIRNAVSHGETSIPINKPMIAEASFTVISLMSLLFERITNGYKSKSYIKSL